MANTILILLAVYFVFWWITLFLLLPFGVRSQQEDGTFVDGTDPGAPVVSRMGNKLIWTTIVSGLLFATAMFAYHMDAFNTERLSKAMGLPI